MLVINVKVKRVVRICRIVRVAAQRFFPADDLAAVLDQHFALSQWLHRKHALAVNARAPRLDAPGVATGCRGSRDGKRRWRVGGDLIF